MEYKIISGCVVEIRRSWMPAGHGAKNTRKNRTAGKSSAKKIQANERAGIERLARVLNCNIEPGWMFVTLKYDDAHLPGNIEELEKSITKFLKKLRQTYKAETGRTPKYIYVNATRSTKHGGPTRYHHHVVIEPCSEDLLRSLWHGGGVICEDVDNRRDHTALAVYLHRNTERLNRSDRRWSTSRGNIAKPIYTEPVKVKDIDGIKAEPGSYIEAMTRTESEHGKPIGGYIRCTLSEKPEVRNGRIILPSTRKRKQKKSAERLTAAPTSV